MMTKMSKLYPKKHITLEQSYLGFGAQIISLISKNITVDELWQKANANYMVKHNFDDLILTLDYLYSIDVIKINQEGKICLN